MISIALTLILLVFAHAAENGNEAVSSTENRLLNLESKPEVVAFVLGDNDEVIPVSADHTGADRRKMSAEGRRSLQTNEPTPADQYMLELINAARANPQGEADALLNGDLNQGLPAGTISADSKQPLSFDHFELWRAALGHSEWMLDNNVFSHTGESGSSPTQRMQSAGYVLTPPWSTGENIAYRGTTGTPDVVQFAKNNHDNLFVSPGHRRNLMSEDFTEVGVSNVAGQFNSWNAVMTTQNFARTGDKGPFITGVVFTDAITDNDFYDAGEGLSGITITAEDVQNQANVFTTVSMGAGGFSLDVNANTVYKVTFSGDLKNDGTSTTAIYEVSVNTENVKQDCVSDDLPSNLPPTSKPTDPATLEPTFEPTNVPTLEPTFEPTNVPTLEPTYEPTNVPTLEPTYEPTNVPTMQLTWQPTTSLTVEPTLEPTLEPTYEPTNVPTMQLTWQPTTSLTVEPSFEPTMEPTYEPTNVPTMQLTWQPTTSLTFEPTFEPTLEPTNALTKEPTLESTMEPTMQLTWQPTTPLTWEPTAEPTNPSTSEPTSRPRWGRWSPWSKCSVTCGSGTKTKTRSCIGTGCVGNSVKTKTCTKRACDVQACDWRALAAAECPSWYEALMMADCHDEMVEGELCEADSKLPNNNRNYNIDNCGAFDVFRYSCEGTR